MPRRSLIATAQSGSAPARSPTEVRPATADDAAAISALVRPLVEKYIAVDLAPEGKRNLLACLTANAVRGHMAKGFCYHVAVDGEKLLGVVAIRDESHVYLLFVADPVRGRGIARRLWHAARAACTRASGRGEFTVNSSRHAVGLYRKLGFVETGRETTRGGVVSVPMRWGPAG